MKLQDQDPRDWIGSDSTKARIREVITFLYDQGTFDFPQTRAALFSAAAGDGADFEATGYANVWTRDTVHIAHSLWTVGERDKAVAAVESLAAFYRSQTSRIQMILKGVLTPRDPMNRPHVRFNGSDLTELPDKWSHAQNDALGYFLWIYALLVKAGDIQLDHEKLKVIQLLVEYLEYIDFTEDEDSGHWEEYRKVEASSIGVVTGALRELESVAREHGQTRESGLHEIRQLKGLIARGEKKLSTILPDECVQTDPLKSRHADAALLFLIEPCRLLQGEGPLGESMARKIVGNIRTHLTGEMGIRRYNGDEYWCADYKEQVSLEKRSLDYSDDPTARGAKVSAGMEAQWCIFDPILSVIHARWFQSNGNITDRKLQLWHLARSLGQLTRTDSQFGPFRCPESYYNERGNWVPNDITPLRWTQANLRLALHWAESTAPEN